MSNYTKTSSISAHFNKIKYEPKYIQALGRDPTPFISQTLFSSNDNSSSGGSIYNFIFLIIVKVINLI